MGNLTDGKGTSMKKEFINAYCYLYGATKEQAKRVYKTTDIKYIQAVIDSYNFDVKKSFLND